MMISLADVFDALVEDETVSIQYASLVRSYLKQGSILDLACGTGAISEQLKADYEVTGLDIDPAMLVQYAKRNPELKTLHQSMTDLHSLPQYDGILLFGDSLNYLLSLDEVEKTLSEAITHLTEQGVFLFDMHNESRYEEFKEEYIEEGVVLDHPFQWTIQSLPEQLINHHFAFFDAQGHAQTLSFNQRVYPLESILGLLNKHQVCIDLYSDFEQGILPDKEKTLFAVRRKI